MKIQPINRQRLIVAISGASGFVYGHRLLQLLQGTDIEAHLILSRAALITMGAETELSLSDVTSLAAQVHKNEDIGACVASGSYKTLGMVIAPCSMKTLAEIANGIGSTLISRISV